jgi:hypothetical protein
MSAIHSAADPGRLTTSVRKCSRPANVNFHRGAAVAVRAACVSASRTATSGSARQASEDHVEPVAAELGARRIGLGQRAGRVP